MRRWDIVKQNGRYWSFVHRDQRGVIHLKRMGHDGKMYWMEYWSSRVEEIIIKGSEFESEMESLRTALVYEKMDR